MKTLIQEYYEGTQPLKWNSLEEDKKIALIILSPTIIVAGILIAIITIPFRLYRDTKNLFAEMIERLQDE